MPCRFFGSITIAFICCRAWDCLPTQESYLQNKTPIIGVWRRAIDYGKHSLSVYHNLYIWLSSSLCLEEVIEMITVLSDCYYCCTSPMCLCREPRDAFKFIKYFASALCTGGGTSYSRTLPLAYPYSTRCSDSFIMVHPPSHFLDPPLDPASNRSTTAPDQVEVYARQILSLGSLYMEFKDSIREGNGLRVLRCYRYLLPIFKSAGRKNNLQVKL